MMGLICNFLMDYAEQVGGEKSRKIVLECLGDKTYHDGHIYPESEFQELFNLVCEVCGQRRAHAEELFGHFSARAVSEKFTGYFDRSKTARELFRIVPSIHTQYPVIAAYGDSVNIFPTSKIIILKDEDDEMIYAYRSSNKMCKFLMAMAKRVSETCYQEKIDIQETQCTQNGAEFCRIIMRWK